MADFAAPSFSLGIDFGPDEPSDPPEPQPRPPPSPRGAVAGGNGQVDGEEGLEWRPEDDEETPKVAPLLKRLRRGLAPSRPPGRGDAGGLLSPQRTDLDDDIEEFSSQEERDEFPSQQYRSVCGSSKLSLHGQRALMTQSASKVKTSNNPSCSNASWSKDLEASGNKKMLPKLTISPIRKIQFLESDSDDASPSTKQESDSCQRTNPCPASQALANDKMKTKVSDCGNSSESLWKDFGMKRTENLATPAFDEFCEEYLSSLKDTDHGPVEEGPSNSDSLGLYQRGNTYQGSDDFNLPVKISHNSCHQGNLPDPQPPAYRYFFHDDVRIRKLVQESLPNFIPLGATSHRRQESEVETFDYMGQFGSKKAPAKPSVAGEKSQKRKSGSRKGSTAVLDDPFPSENWVNPRSCMTYPKDAGRRRVHVESRSTGHWYTQGGRKVYISKGGEELSGRAAYRCYRKESGVGFRKTRKKAVAKKKAKSVFDGCEELVVAKNRWCRSVSDLQCMPKL